MRQRLALNPTKEEMLAWACSFRGSGQDAVEVEASIRGHFPSWQTGSKGWFYWPDTTLPKPARSPKVEPPVEDQAANMSFGEHFILKPEHPIICFKLIEYNKANRILLPWLSGKHRTPFADLLALPPSNHLHPSPSICLLVVSMS